MGKTFLCLTTVLRYLHHHPHSYALWLDTTGSFSAEWGSAIIEGVCEAGSTSAPPSEEQPGITRPTPSNALDRLIVAKAFDLQAAIQAIQSIQRDGFPGGSVHPTETED